MRGLVAPLLDGIDGCLNQQRVTRNHFKVVDRSFFADFGFQNDDTLNARLLRQRRIDRLHLRDQVGGDEHFHQRGRAAAAVAVAVAAVGAAVEQLLPAAFKTPPSTPDRHARTPIPPTTPTRRTAGADSTIRAISFGISVGCNNRARIDLHLLDDHRRPEQLLPAAAVAAAAVAAEQSASSSAVASAVPNTK